MSATILDKIIDSNSTLSLGKPFCYNASDLDLISLPLFVARPAQPSIVPGSVNGHWIIPGLTLGHQRWGLLPSNTTGSMTGG